MCAAAAVTAAALSGSSTDVLNTATLACVVTSALLALCSSRLRRLSASAITADGDGFLVVDPKSDLCEEILARLPADRLDDVVVLNPAATGRPIGLNVLQAARDEASRELVVDNVVRIFSEIWKASFGPRTTDVLRNALLTLTATKAPDGSAFTLAEVAPLLENPRFRRSVTGQRGVPEPVRSFWQSYEAMSPAQRAQLVGPSLNKLRALTTRTSLRLMLGQSAGIEVGDVFTKRRIVLVSLNKGVIGSEGAALLGSLVVALLWQAALKRAAVPVGSRRSAWAYLDEFQDVLRLSDDVPDALSQARALGPSGSGSCWRTSTWASCRPRCKPRCWARSGRGWCSSRIMTTPRRWSGGSCRR